MRRALAILVIMLLTLPAYAQRMGGKDHRSKDDQSQSAQQKEKKRADEEAYKRAIKSIPDKPPPVDPWKNVSSLRRPSLKVFGTARFAKSPRALLLMRLPGNHSLTRMRVSPSDRTWATIQLPHSRSSRPSKHSFA